MQALTTVLALFSGPIGQLLTSTLTAGTAAFTAWQISKGMPADSAAVISGAMASAAGALIHTFTGLQVVQEKAINRRQG